MKYSTLNFIPERVLDIIRRHRGVSDAAPSTRLTVSPRAANAKEIEAMELTKHLKEVGRRFSKTTAEAMSQHHSEAVMGVAHIDSRADAEDDDFLSGRPVQVRDLGRGLSAEERAEMARAAGASEPDGADGKIGTSLDAQDEDTGLVARDVRGHKELEAQLCDPCASIMRKARAQGTGMSVRVGALKEGGMCSECLNTVRKAIRDNA